MGPVANGKVYAAGGGLYVFTASTGELLWRAPFVQAVAVARGVLYATASTPDPGLYALNASDGRCPVEFSLGRSLHCRS